MSGLELEMDERKFVGILLPKLGGGDSLERAVKIFRRARTYRKIQVLGAIEHAEDLKARSEALEHLEELSLRRLRFEPDRAEPTGSIEVYRDPETQGIFLRVDGQPFRRRELVSV